MERNPFGVRLQEDVDDWITAEMTHREDSEIRERQNRKGYPFINKVGIDLNRPPTDYRRCKGRIGICPLMTWNWRACLNAS